MAAFTPSFNYNFEVLNTTVQISSWRQLLYWLGPPGKAGSWQASGLPCTCMLCTTFTCTDRAAAAITAACDCL